MNNNRENHAIQNGGRNEGGVIINTTIKILMCAYFLEGLLAIIFESMLNIHEDCFRTELNIYFLCAILNVISGATYYYRVNILRESLIIFICQVIKIIIAILILYTINCNIINGKDLQIFHFYIIFDITTVSLQILTTCILLCHSRPRQPNLTVDDSYYMNWS